FCIGCGAHCCSRVCAARGTHLGAQASRLPPVHGAPRSAGVRAPRARAPRHGTATRVVMQKCESHPTSPLHFLLRHAIVPLTTDRPPVRSQPPRTDRARWLPNISRTARHTTTWMAPSHRTCPWFIVWHVLHGGAQHRN